MYIKQSSLLLIGYSFIGECVHASANSPFSTSGNYVPSVVTCPSNTTFVRSAAQGLASSEESWLRLRKPIVVNALEAYLTNVSIPGFNVSSYISAIKSNNSENAPILALSISGGGTRAQLNGQGIYRALDAREPSSLQAKTGGLLQALTYFAGLSGGATGVAGIALNDFPAYSTLLANGNLNQSQPTAAFNEIALKAQAGFNFSIADVFGINQVYNQASKPQNTSFDPLSLTWSGIQAMPNFAAGMTPMPLLMHVEVVPPGLSGSNSYNSTMNGTFLLTTEGSTTVYESTPFEFGSWTGRVKSFVDMQYLGTNFQNGNPVNSTQCVVDYDSGAFITGLALTALNYWTTESLTNGTVGQFAKRSVDESDKRRNSYSPRNDFFPRYQRRSIPYPENEDVLEQERVEFNDIGLVKELPYILGLFGNPPLQDVLYGKIPNPFMGLPSSAGVEQIAASQEDLWLVDGSETGQEIPLWPLIQPSRKLDFVIASDNGGTELSSGWQNGTSLLNVYNSSQVVGLPFPKIPDVNTMLNLNLTSKPTFFGCNEQDVPLILYLADYPYTAYTNISSALPFGTALSVQQIELIQQNGLVAISQNNSGLNANWTSCLACAAIYRSLQRMGTEIPSTCQQCFSDHCWQGETDVSQPSFLEPTLALNSSLTFEVWNTTVFSAM